MENYQPFYFGNDYTAEMVYLLGPENSGPNKSYGTGRNMTQTISTHKSCAFGFSFQREKRW